MLSYGISTTLLQILSSLILISYSSSQRRPLVFQQKAIWTFGSIRPGFLKKGLLENFCILCIQGWALFRYTWRPSWDYSKKLFRAVIMQTGIYPSNSDVHYLVQKTFNWVLKLNLKIYISVCWVVCLFVYSNFLTAKCKRYLHFSYMQFIDYLQIHGITHIAYLNV